MDDITIWLFREVLDANKKLLKVKWWGLNDMVERFINWIKIRGMEMSNDECLAQCILMKCCLTVYWSKTIHSSLYMIVFLQWNPWQKNPKKIQSWRNHIRYLWKSWSGSSRSFWQRWSPYLPRNPGGQVLHDHSVVCPCWGSVPRIKELVLIVISIILIFIMIRMTSVLASVLGVVMSPAKAKMKGRVEVSTNYFTLHL